MKLVLKDNDGDSLIVDTFEDISGALYLETKPTCGKPLLLEFTRGDAKELRDLLNLAFPPETVNRPNLTAPAILLALAAILLAAFPLVFR